MKLAIIADDLPSLVEKKDTTIGLIRYAWQQGDSVVYATPRHLSLTEEGASITGYSIEAGDRQWYRATKINRTALMQFDAVLLRKDPPCDMSFHTMLQLMAVAEQRGLVVINSARGILRLNEKISTLQLPQYIPQTLISADRDQLLDFVSQQKETILKPLWRMSGQGVFRVNKDDSNTRVILELLLEQESMILAQEFIPEIIKGDRRMFIIAGQACDQVLVRVPKPGEHRANLATGGSWYQDSVSKTEQKIAASLKPLLEENGILFAGIDIIGGRLTEINVTSPTGARMLQQKEMDLFYQALYQAIQKRIRM